MKLVNQALEPIIQPLLSKYGPFYAKIVSNWNDIVGINISLYTIPKKITFTDPNNKKSGTLYIEVAHSSIATTLVYNQNVIIEKIATYFGYKAVTSLKLIHNPVNFTIEEFTEDPKELVINPEQAVLLNNSLNIITDDSLKMALYSLGSNIYASKHQ